MDAFFFIDKPTGLTSFGVLRDMRRILWIRKIGHSGTLDPLATGGLLVATGNYTKLIPFVEKDSKSYRASVMLDGSSPSYDSDTEICFLSEEKKREFQSSLTQKQIEQILKEKFLGKIEQIPPKYSALKIDGKRALDRTLAGQEIEMKSREVEIFSCEILSFAYPVLELEVSVSAGTYIRSIAHNLWNILGTWGYLSALRRTKVGNIDITDATSLEQLDASQSIPLESVLWEKIHLFQDELVYKRLWDGQRVKWEFLLPQNTEILLFDGNMVRYIVEYKNGVIHPRKKIT